MTDIPTLTSLYDEAHRRAMDVRRERPNQATLIKSDLAPTFGRVHVAAHGGRIHLVINLSSGRVASARWIVHYDGFTGHGDGIAPGFAQLEMILRGEEAA